MLYRRKFRRTSRRPTRSGVKRGFRGTRFRRRPMTSGRVKRIIGAELKFRDLDTVRFPIPNTDGSVVHITDIAQGDLTTERNGNWIKPVVWRGTLTIEGNEDNITQDTSLFRVGCLQWKENQDSDPIELAKFMQDTTAPHQGFNIQAKGSFKILWSRTGIVSNNTDNPQFQKVLRFSVRPSMKVLYDGADFRKYHLFIFGFSEVNSGAGNPPNYQISTRFRFTDS